MGNDRKPVHGGYPDVQRGPIMLEMAAADDAHQMWERRWRAMTRMYVIGHPYVDRDGRWGLRDFLAYVGQACGFEAETPSHD